MFEKRKVNPMYFTGLIFLIFPIVYAWGDIEFPFIVGSSLLFGFFYISLLYTRNPLYEKVAWFYMLFYVLYTTFAGNIQSSLFLFNLSNLLTWHYTEDRWTYRTISYILTLIICLSWAIMGPFTWETVVFMFVLHSFALFMFYGGRQEVAKEQMERQLQEQNASINLLIAENERNRIGQDLHDSLGHVFATLAIKAELGLKQLEKGNLLAVQQELEDLQATSRKSMMDVRNIVNQLKFRSLEEELQDLQGVFEMAGIVLQIQEELEVSYLSPVLQSNLTMMVRELANNVIKHAEASHVCLRFKDLGDQFVVEMEDDGKGFLNQTDTELVSLRNRLSLIHGKVTIESASRPTLVRLTLPFRKE